MIVCAFNIDQKAILLCWAHYDESELAIVEPGLEDPSDRVVRVEPNPPVPSWRYEHHLLRSDRTGRYRLRWSLIRPTGDDVNIVERAFAFYFKSKLKITLTPLTFDRVELAEFLAELQEITRPDILTYDPVTLGEVEALIYP